MKITIGWPERGRAVTAPSSALSARIVVRAAGSEGADLEFLANRSGDESAHGETYTSPMAGRPGQRTIETRFFAGLDATGATVGEAVFEDNIGANGVIDKHVLIDSKIAKVEVAAAQHVLARIPKRLMATAFDDTHNVVVLPVDAFRWHVTGGNEKLRFTDNLAEGLLAGIASVAAVVDGTTSKSTNLEVRPSAELLNMGPVLSGNIDAVSKNGKVIVGGSGDGNAFRWTQETGRQKLIDAQSADLFRAPAALSADGSIVVGYSSVGIGTAKHAWIWQNGQWTYPQFAASATAMLDAISRNGQHMAGTFSPNSVPRAFVWKAGSQPQTLDLSPDADKSFAREISDDGSIVAGVQEFGSVQRATLWRNGVPELIPLPPGTTSVSVNGMSADGGVVVGEAISGTGSATIRKGFAWSAASGPIMIRPDGTKDRVLGIRGDGEFLVANFNLSGYVSDPAGQFENLKSYVAKTYGLQLNPDLLNFALFVSDDGRTFAGGTWLLRPVEE